MRKMMLFVLILCLLPLAGLADTDAGILFAGWEDDIGIALSTALTSLTGIYSESSGEGTVALNDAAGSDWAALVTQQALLEGLQGYTDCEVRTDLQLLLPLAKDELFLVVSGETAETCGLTDLPSLQAFLTEHPFELTLMRSFEASAADYAAVQVFNALDLDTDTFSDPEDCAENLVDGSYLMVADTAAAQVLSEEGAVVLGPLSEVRSSVFPDLPAAGECSLPVCLGNVWALYLAAEGDTEPWLEQLLPAVEDPAFKEILEANGLLPVAPEDFPLAELLNDYVTYMTEEGLFFYE